MAKVARLQDRYSQEGSTRDVLKTNPNDTNRSVDADVHQTGPASGKAAANRPLTASQLQPSNADQNGSLHVTHGSKAIKKNSSRSRTKNSAPALDRAPSAPSSSITAFEMLQMALVQANAEKDAQAAAIAATIRQEAEIADLKEEKSGLLEQINALNSVNEELVEKTKSFQTRCEKYKSHINGVIRAQKQLDKDAKILDERRFEIAHAKALELDESYQVAREQMLSAGKLKPALQEARKALADGKYRCSLPRRYLITRLRGSDN
jgi:hypothetical protein